MKTKLAGTCRSRVKSSRPSPGGAVESLAFCLAVLLGSLRAIVSVLLVAGVAWTVCVVLIVWIGSAMLGQSCLYCFLDLLEPFELCVLSWLFFVLDCLDCLDCFE